MKKILPSVAGWTVARKCNGANFQRHDRKSFSRVLSTVAMVGLLVIQANTAREERNISTITVPHKHTNRLIKESSPYLQQHAHNPVDWYPWGSEAFEQAQKEGKPIFLSIGYSTCHWCNVNSINSLKGLLGEIAGKSSSSN